MENEFVYRMEKSEAEAALGFLLTDEEWAALVAAMEIDEFGPAMAAFVCTVWSSLQAEREE
jgi:predicted branched-subunit amino acid permease